MAFGVYSCQKEQFDDKQVSGEEQSAETTQIIYATLPEDGTRTHLEPNGTKKYKVVWDEGDMIAVVGTNGDATYRLKEGAGSQSGIFEYYSGKKDITGPYHAYYPSTMYDAGKAVWPAEQTYIAEGMITGAPMQAEKAAEESLEEPFKFSNMGGVIRFTLKRAEGASAQSVKSLTVTTANTEIYTLKCRTAVEIPEGTDGVKFYMALPAGDYSTLRFEFATTGNSILTLTATKPISIVRSEISSVAKTAKNEDWENEEDLEWIDLGLPSGLLWANKNLGAANATSQGDYYFWGETTPWFTYTYNETYKTYPITWKSDAYRDASTEAKWIATSNMKKIPWNLVGYYKKYDVAYLRTGVGQMPSQADWEELVAYTTKTYETENGIKCVKFTNKSDNTKFIRLPFAGRYQRSNEVISSVNSYAEYMSSSYDTNDNGSFYTIFSDFNGGIGFKTSQEYKRYNVAVPVRAVRQTQEIQFVDLGLSVLWADRNLGATSAIGKQSYGNYYVWGYTDADYYTYNPNTEGRQAAYTKWDGTWDGDGAAKFGGKYNPTDKKTKLDNMDDAAWVASNGEYRMPTVAELEELLQYTKQTNIDTNNSTYGKINGKVLTSKVEGYTYQSIFLPAAGTFGSAGSYTRITSSELQTGAATGHPYGPVMELYNGYTGGSTGAALKMTQQDNSGFIGSMRYNGLAIRPVKDKK